MTEPNTITVSIVTQYSLDDAAGIGRLMPSLDPGFSSEPISEDLLRSIVESPSHDQLVARNASGAIVGVATLSITIGAGAGRKAYLEDFVVDPDIQSHGVGSRLWDAMLAWASAHQAASLHFTSGPTRTAAHAFYRKHGAEIHDTSVFTIDV